MIKDLLEEFGPDGEVILYDPVWGNGCLVIDTDGELKRYNTSSSWEMGDGLLMCSYPEGLDTSFVWLGRNGRPMLVKGSDVDREADTTIVDMMVKGIHLDDIFGYIFL